MKKLNFVKPVIVFLFLSFSYLSNAQHKVYGQWTVECAIERTDASSMNFCGICPIKDLNNSSFDIKTIDIYIDEKNIRIGELIPISYKWDDLTYTIQFTHEKNLYTFKVLKLYDSKTLIWKEANGTILYLRKI